MKVFYTTIFVTLFCTVSIFIQYLDRYEEFNEDYFKAIKLTVESRKHSSGIKNTGIPLVKDRQLICNHIVSFKREESLIGYDFLKKASQKEIQRANRLNRRILNSVNYRFQRVLDYLNRNELNPFILDDLFMEKEVIISTKLPFIKRDSLSDFTESITLISVNKEAFEFIR